MIVAKTLKFDRVAAEKELDSLTSQFEVMIDEDKHPQLYKMQKRGNKHHWDDFFKSEDKRCDQI